MEAAPTAPGLRDGTSSGGTSSRTDFHLSY